MHHLHVLFEHDKQKEELVALHALERHELRVLDPGVVTHGRLSVEAFPTVVAGVRPFTSVSHHNFFYMTFQFLSVPTYLSLKTNENVFDKMLRNLNVFQW